jgi:hypothetical protein
MQTIREHISALLVDEFQKRVERLVTLGAATFIIDDERAALDALRVGHLGVYAPASEDAEELLDRTFAHVTSCSCMHAGMGWRERQHGACPSFTYTTEQGHVRYFPEDRYGRVITANPQDLMDPLRGLKDEDIRQMLGEQAEEMEGASRKELLDRAAAVLGGRVFEATLTLRDGPLGD